MEFERFFHYGQNDMLAKWYLINGSCNIPQRLLCKKSYATKMKMVSFGAYPIHNITYTYVIVNIFTIPYNGLENFYYLYCDNGIKDVKMPAAEGANDYKFTKSFSSNHEKRHLPYTHIDIQPTDTQSNYLVGLPAQQSPIFPLNFHVTHCNTVRDLDCMDIDDQPYLKRSRNDINDITTTPPQSIPSTFTQDTQPSTVPLQSPYEDQNLSIPANPLQNNFPSDAIQLVFVQKNLDALSAAIANAQKEILYTAGLKGSLEMDNNTIIQRDNMNAVVQRYMAATQTLQLYNRAKTEVAFKFPTYVYGDNETYLMQFLTDVAETGLFDDFLSKFGDEIVEVVESDDVRFGELVRQKPQYVSLFGLRAFLRSNSQFSTFMAIVCARMYNTIEFTQISEMFIRIYFKAKKAPIALNAASVNLYFNQKLEIPDEEMQSLLQDLEKIKSILEPLIPEILQLDPVAQIRDDGKLLNKNYFFINLIPIDTKILYLKSASKKIYQILSVTLYNTVIGDETKKFHAALPSPFNVPVVGTVFGTFK